MGRRCQISCVAIRSPNGHHENIIAERRFSAKFVALRDIVDTKRDKNLIDSLVDERSELGILPGTVEFF